MFAFHLHALIDICKPWVAVQKSLSRLIFLLPALQLNPPQHFNSRHSACVWMWVVSHLFPSRFWTFFFFLQENFHRISNPSYLHFNVLLKVLLIKYPIFVHSCNFNSCCWKPSSVCLRYYLLKKQNWAKISGMCWWLVKNTAELGWSGGSILVGRKGEWAPAAPAAMISPAKKFLRTSEKV